MEKNKKHSFRRRYMKDYELQVELNDDGREVKVPRYIGSMYETGLTPAELKELRRSSVACSLGAAAADVTALSLRHSAMSSILAILPLALCMFPLFYSVLGSFRLPREAGKLRSDEVEYSFERVRHSAPGITVLGTAAAAGTLVFHLFIRKAGLSALIWGDVAFLLCCFVLAACGALMWRRMRRIKIEALPGKRGWEGMEKEDE